MIYILHLNAEQFDWCEDKIADTEKKYILDSVVYHIIDSEISGHYQKRLLLFQQIVLWERVPLNQSQVAAGM